MCLLGARQPVRPAEHRGCARQRRDRQAVPVRQHLVVAPRPHALRPRLEQHRAGPRQRCLVLRRSRRRDPPQDRVALPVAACRHVVGALERRPPRHRAARPPPPRSRHRICPPRPRCRHPRTRRMPRGLPRAPRSCRAPSSRRSPRRAADTAGPADARAPAPAAPATARCRTASSRNAAPARSRRWNSGHSRRRDGRRCRPATCAAASGAAPSCPSGAPVRNAFCHRKRKIGGLGNFGAPRSPPCSGSFIRSSAAATASRCTGAGKSPEWAADIPASTRRSAAVFFATISWSVRYASDTPCSTWRNDGRPQRGSGGK